MRCLPCCTPFFVPIPTSIVPVCPPPLLLLWWDIARVPATCEGSHGTAAVLSQLGLGSSALLQQAPARGFAEAVHDGLGKADAAAVG